LQLPGWEQSSGMAAEIEFANNNGIPVRHVEIPEFTVYMSSY
jgi:hypothetical protein